MKAQYLDYCVRCNGDIQVGDEIVPRAKGTYMHKRCAPGGDDE